MEKVNLEKFAEYTFESVPSWALPYIANGDAEGLSEEDISLIEKWENKMLELGFKPDVFDFVREDENGEIYLDDTFPCDICLNTAIEISHFRIPQPLSKLPQYHLVWFFPRTFQAEFLPC